MARRVLITGGFGFIGSNLALRCLELGHEVTLLDNMSPEAGGNRANVEDFAERLKVIDGDIRDDEACRQALAGQDVVFHCAALTSHLGSMHNPRENVSVNCLGTITLLDAMRQHNPGSRFVYVGTSTQTGPMRTTRVDELHPEFPVDMYSANKSAAEKYVLIYAKAYGLATSVVRLANVYGPRAHIRNAQFGFVNFFIGLALQGRDITIFGDGAQSRNLSYVGDCVEALLAAANAPQAIGEVFFAAADEHLSVAQIAAAIVECMGGQVRFDPWPKERKAIDVGDMLIDNAKIKQTLGWTPQIDLQQGLAQTLAYYQARLDRYL
jgi:UDP-glucose 4-epimerase